jgi:hypothetical protein
MTKIDIIINYFRNLREENIPTNNVGDGGLTSRGEELSGFDPVMSFRRRKNGNVDGRSVSNRYKKWLKSLGHLN